MDIKIVTIDADKITDHISFHAVFAEVFGFSGSYGRNMNAWIDCMTSIDIPSDRMSEVTIGRGGLVVMRIENAADFKKRCPDLHNDLVECTAMANYCRVEMGGTPVLALMMIGFY